MARLILAAIIAAIVLPTSTMAKGPKHCPPGLAKKNPACVPPGQAKKDRYRDYRDDVADHDDNLDHDRDEYRILRVGDRIVLDGEEYTVVRTGDPTIIRRDGDFYRLPRIGDGSEYVRVGNAILKVDRKTKAVFEIIELADLILS